MYKQSINMKCFYRFLIEKEAMIYNNVEVKYYK